MIEPVERKIQEINTAKKRALKKQKEQNLLRWGFDGKKKNKNDIPLILTDEEYDAILAADKEYSAAAKTDRNPVANLLFIFAIIAVVVGIVGGIVLYQLKADAGFVYLSASIFLGVVFGVLFYGLSEIVKMLQQLIDKN